MKNIIKIILFLGLIQLFLLFFIDYSFNIGIFAFTNLLILLIWMFLDNDFDTVYSKYSDKLNKLQNMLYPTDEQQKHSAILMLFGHIIKNYLFSISFFVLIFVFTNEFGFHMFDLNFGRALFWFVVFSILNAKNILNNDIFLGNRRLFIKDFVLIISLFLGFFTYYELQDGNAIYKICLSIIIASIFYFVFYGFLGLNKFRKTNKGIKFYIFLDILAIIGTIYFNIPQIQNYCVKEKIVEKVITQTQYADRIVYTGCQQTGSTQTNTGNNLTGDSSLTGQILSGQTQTSTTTGQTISSTGAIQEASNIDIYKIPVNTALTYKNLIPFLVKKYNLKKLNSTDVTFNKITKDSPYYKDFLIAYQHRLFGKTSNPDAKLKCQNLAVLVGLIKGWKVEYTNDTIYDKFRVEAQNQGFLTSSACETKDTLLTSKNLNF